MPAATQPFSKWAFSTVDRLRKLVGIGSVAAGAAALSSLEPVKLLTLQGQELRAAIQHSAPSLASLLMIQAVTCAALALLTPRAHLSWLDRVPDLSEERKEKAIKACHRIRLNLVAVFILWTMYYLLSSIALFSGQEAPPSDWVIKISLSALTALVIFWLYLELSKLTVRSTSAPAPPDDEASVHRLVSAGIFFAMIGLAWFAHERDWVVIVRLVDLLVACLSGIALCLVVGRLGNEYIDPGPAALSLLYLYGVIQPAAALFRDDALVYLIATTLALPLKVLFWLICVWAFTTGVLAEYVYEVRAILEKQANRRSQTAIIQP